MLGEHALLVVVVVLGEHQLSVLQDRGCVYLVRRVHLAYRTHTAHLLRRLLYLGLQFSLLRRFLRLLVDRLYYADVVFVEVVGEHGVGVGEVVARVLERLVLADDLHWLRYNS